MSKINPKELETGQVNTWCPGCSDFSILAAFKKALTELNYKQEDYAIVTGIGCHAKIFDYLKLSGIYGLHGRVLPTALGIKMGNPNLKVIGIGGDGDTYDEGMEHFIHSCRYNSDFSMLVFDNQTFALTTGQATATSEIGFNDRTKIGVRERPFNPIRVALASGASFVARTYALDISHMSEIIKKAIEHKGFSFVEILQPCLSFNDTREFLNKSVYKIEGNDPLDKKHAMELAEIWNYNLEGKVPLGLFYQKEEKTFEELQPALAELKNKKQSWWQVKRKVDVKSLMG